jgi:hypothetical protein
LRGISGEDGERDLEPPAFQKLQQGNGLFPVLLDADDVNQLAAGFGKVGVGGFRLFQLLQPCVDRAFSCSRSPVIRSAPDCISAF